jgi:hypothetical protein
MDINEDSANLACAAYVGQLDSGFFLFHTVAHAEVARCPLYSTAFGAPSGGISTMDVVSADVEDTDVDGGTIQHAHLAESDDTLTSKLTCGVGTGEVQFSSLVFALHEELKITAFTVAWPVTSIA